MKNYTALVTDIDTKERITITRDYPTKQEFIIDLRRNGFAVDPSHVKTTKEFNRIMDTTNAEPWQWYPRKYKI